MPFSNAEKEVLLSVNGVGPTVVKRFEEIGINRLDDLATYEADVIAEMVASMLRNTCWKNSPKSKAAITAAIKRAKEEL